MTKYWVGGTGNWSDTTHWSASSGGAGSDGVPGTGDSVVFDTSSSAAEAAYTITVDAAANCLDFTMDGPSTTDATKVTWAGSAALNIYGSMNLSGGTAGITRSYTGTITFLSTSVGKTVDTNGITTASSINFNGSGGSWQLQNNVNNGTAGITLTIGTLDTNGKTVTCGNFTGNSSSLKTLTLGASTLNVTQWSFTDTSNTTLNANTSTINCATNNQFGGGGLTYNNYVNTGTIPQIDGANTFANLTFTGPANTSGRLKISANQIITGTLTFNGNSAVNRILVSSNTLGTARTITTTGGSVAITNCDFQDITATGDAGDWDLSAIAGGSGDCGGNTNITFTTADDWYWHADTGNVSDYTKWYTATNGGGSQMASTLVPLPQDTLHFDASSFDSGSQTITQNMPRIGSIDFTGATNTPTFTTSTYANVFGSITLISGMTLTASTQDYSFYNRGNYTLDSGGLSWVKPIRFYGPGGVCTLKSNLTTSNTATIGIYSGSEVSVVDGANNWSISTGILTMFSGCFLNPGSATHYITRLTGIGMTGSGTFRTNTSTFKWIGALTGDVTFTTGNINYNGASIWNATTNNYALIINNSSTFNDFKIDAGRTVKFTNSTNTTVTTFTALGTSGSHIVISNTSSTTPATLTKAGGGVITGCDYVDSTYITGSPDVTWYMGANSTNTDCTNMYLSAVAAYELICAVTAYTLTGINVNILRPIINMVTEVSEFILTPMATGLYRGLGFLAITTNYTLTGINAIFKKAQTLATSVTSFTLTGIDILVSRSINLITGVTNYTLTGINALLKKALNIVTSVTAFTLTTVNATLHKALKPLVATVTNFVITGIEIGIGKNATKKLILRFSLLKQTLGLKTTTIKTNISTKNNKLNLKI